MSITVLPYVPSRSDRIASAVMNAIGVFQSMRKMGMEDKLTTAQINELERRGE